MKRQIVGLVVLFSVFACLLTTIIVNSKYIFRTEPYYSETQVEEMCDEAYKQSIKDNSDQALYNKMSELTVQNLELTNTNNSLITENKSLKNQVVANEKIINDLNLQIENLTNVKLENETEIFNLNLIVSALEIQVSELEKQNKLLEYEISQNEILIEENNKTISQLENSILVYDDYINGVESDKEVFAIFVVEKEIINVQKLNINGLAYLENQPIFDENTTFNGWAVNNEIVDLTTYTLSCNTTFVADLTYSYTVNFIVDDVNYNSQNIVENNNAVLPEDPTKEGYIFVGWSLNKVDIISNIDTIKVTKNINYYAMFEKAYTVTFMVENEVYNSQIIQFGYCANDIVLDSTSSKTFNGWSVDNQIIDVENYQIYSDTIFIADFTYYYDVQFMVDGSLYNTKTIADDEFVVLPTEPTKDSNHFIGWSLDGSSVIDNIDEIYHSSNTVYYAVFETIVVTKNVRYNNSNIGLLTISSNKTVIALNSGWEADDVYLKISTSSSDYWIISISRTEYIYFDNINVTWNASRYVGGTFVEDINGFNIVSCSSDKCLTYSFPCGGSTLSTSKFNSMDMFNYTYGYIYTLQTGSDLSNQVNLMSNCVTTRSFNDTTTTIVLPTYDNIIGYAIYVENPILKYFEFSDDILSSNLTYLGNVGATVDMSAYRDYGRVYIFAIYNTN